MAIETTSLVFIPIYTICQYAVLHIEHEGKFFVASISNLHFQELFILPRRGVYTLFLWSDRVRQNSKFSFPCSSCTAEQLLPLLVSRSCSESFSQPGKRSWVSPQTAHTPAIRGCSLLYFQGSKGFVNSCWRSPSGTTSLRSSCGF